MQRHRWLSLALLLSLGSWLVAQAAQPAGPARASTAAGTTAAAPSGAPRATPAGEPQDAVPASSKRHEIPLSDVTLALFWLGVAVLAAVLAWLGRAKGLLRDGGPNSPWSLGRSQMAWWFLVVVASFVFIWLVTGDYKILTPSVLALIGISSGTALSGAVIDDGKQSQVDQRQVLQAEQNQLQQTNQHLASAAAPPAGGAGAAALANAPVLQSNFARLDTIAGKLAQLPTRQTPRNSFWLDILSDENGISFHRLQIVAWTVVLTVIFIYQVHAQHEMPDFDAQLLGLMGISSGTYIGFKFPEKQA